ncbi:MAG: cytochrome b N-terminal domain-containing protein [Vicinamibacteria bacterium]
MDATRPQAAARPAVDWMERLHGASALCAFVFAGLLSGSGIGLAMSYVPSQTEAFASVLYLRRQGGIGALLRAMHYQLSSGIVVAAFLMVITAVISNIHRERKWEFRLSVVALLLMIGFCFTGYVLPMDQPAYWGTSVRLGIVETVPVVGGMQADMLRGGPTFGAATLPRFYALHVAALPIILVILVLVGFKDALDRAAKAGGKWIIPACGLIAIAAWVVAANFRAPLEPRAAAADTDYVPRPEWYFLWLFQLGKYVHGFQWVESALLPAVGIGTLLILPELATRRKLRTTGVILLLGFMFGLGSLALYDDRDLPRKPQYEEGLVLTAARNYKVECASCHGVSGKGDGADISKLQSKPKNFTRENFWDDGTMADIVEVVTKGEAPDMPAFGGRLSEEEILALARHIEANFRPRAATGSR